jgi:hypothetical protein
VQRAAFEEATPKKIIRLENNNNLKTVTDRDYYVRFEHGVMIVSLVGDREPYTYGMEYPLLLLMPSSLHLPWLLS